MSVRVCPKPNGDVVVGRRVPGSLDAASVTQLRFTAAEWAEFVEGVRAGGFDSTMPSPSRGSQCAGRCAPKTPGNGPQINAAGPVRPPTRVWVQEVSQDESEPRTEKALA